MRSDGFIHSLLVRSRDRETVTGLLTLWGNHKLLRDLEGGHHPVIAAVLYHMLALKISIVLMEQKDEVLSPFFRTENVLYMVDVCDLRCSHTVKMRTSDFVKLQVLCGAEPPAPSHQNRMSPSFLLHSSDFIPPSLRTPEKLFCLSNFYPLPRSMYRDAR
jgi:hypothetical protein